MRLDGARRMRLDGARRMRLDGGLENEARRGLGE